MSTELLRVSLLHGASNDIVLPGDDTSRGGEILCKLVGDGKSLAARVLPPQPGAGSWHQPGRVHGPDNDTLTVVPSHTTTQPFANRGV